MSHFPNLIHHFMDLFSEKEFIITLSGAGGAGKTTVISDLSLIIEKNLGNITSSPLFLPVPGVWT
ncbi:hypothetical protein [Chryseobacterium bernardetii]|uniref:hypothetical protein n=1 Tax=Chryseobacterium bernardetii TaxID=1241978 RepID=UPI0030165D05